MPSEERYTIGQFASFAVGDDGKGAATAGIPIDCNVFWIDLDRSAGANLRVWSDLRPTFRRFESHAFLDTRTLS